MTLPFIERRLRAVPPCGAPNVVVKSVDGYDYTFTVSTVQLGVAKYTRVQLEGAILTHYPGILNTIEAVERAFEGYVR
jgi:hypothetical protein